MRAQEYAFGATSAVMTGLAIIIGLSETVNAKTNIVAALLIIAVADNLTDSFGLHIHASQSSTEKTARRTAFANFGARLAITLLFVSFILLLPILAAAVICVVIGIAVVIALSYLIARQRREDPRPVIVEHVVLAVLLMVLSFFLRGVISRFA